MKFKSRVAFITGGASGIGRATAIALAREGAICVIVDIHDRNAKQTAEIITNNNGTASFLKADITDPKSVAAALDTTVSKYGRLDIVVNSAGIGGWEAFTELNRVEDQSKWMKVVDLNLTALISVTQLAIYEMKKLGNPGVIINISSMGGLLAMPYTPVYAASKAGVVHFTRSLAGLKDLLNIRVNAVCPSYTSTPLLNNDHPVARDAIIKEAGGLLSPDTVAQGIVELCKDETKTGAIMRVTVQKGIDYLEPRTSKL